MNKLKTWLFGLTLFSYTALCAMPITVPSSLSPGDFYRLVFVTSTTTDATSSNIADYNAFVQGVADGQAQLNALGATWNVIGSTATVDARDNTETNPLNGSHPDVPIYNLNDLIVADNKADLWDGALDNAIQYDETGAIPSLSIAWTGSNSDGTAFVGQELGSTSLGVPTRYGITNFSGFPWINSESTSNTSFSYLYAISSVLQVPTAVVPEPGTYLMLGSTLFIAAHLKKKKKA